MPIKQNRPQAPSSEPPVFGTIREALAAYQRFQPLVQTILELGSLLAYTQRAVDESDRAKRAVADLAAENTRLTDLVTGLKSEHAGLTQGVAARTTELNALNAQVEDRRENLAAALEGVKREHDKAVADAGRQHE